MGSILLHLKSLRFTWRDPASLQSKFSIVVGLFPTAPFHCRGPVPRKVLREQLCIIFRTPSSRGVFQAMINLSFCRPMKDLLLPQLLLPTPIHKRTSMESWENLFPRKISKRGPSFFPPITVIVLGID